MMEKDLDYYLALPYRVETQEEDDGCGDGDVISFLTFAKSRAAPVLAVREEASFQGRTPVFSRRLLCFGGCCYVVNLREFPDVVLAAA